MVAKVPDRVGVMVLGDGDGEDLKSVAVFVAKNEDKNSGLLLVVNGKTGSEKERVALIIDDDAVLLSIAASARMVLGIRSGACQENALASKFKKIEIGEMLPPGEPDPRD